MVDLDDFFSEGGDWMNLRKLKVYGLIFGFILIAFAVISAVMNWKYVCFYFMSLISSFFNLAIMVAVGIFIFKFITNCFKRK